MGYDVTEEFLTKTYSNPDNDLRGVWTTSDLSANHKGPYFPVVNPNTKEVFYPPKGCYWVFNEQEVLKRIEDGRIIFGKSGNSRPIQKVFGSQRKYGKVGAESWWNSKGMNSDATTEIKELFDEPKLFTHPKPSKLLYHIVSIATDKDSIILDFFSGSSTTAHAVMQLNAEDGGNRKFIMVQLPEVCDPKSEAAKAGYKTICEIGKEGIRRAGAKIEKELKAKNEGLFAEDAKPLDTGFRVFKLDTTNMKDVYYAAGQLSQKDLWDTVSNIKDDRSDIDLLYGCLLDWGVQLTMPHTTEQIESFTVHTVDSPQTDEIDFIACFDSEVSETVVRTIAKRKPTRALFRDSSFADSANKINVVEIFKSISPDTTVKVT